MIVQYELMRKHLSKFVIQGRTVKPVKGNVVVLDYDVKDAVEIGDVLIVILDVPDGTAFTENVFAISETGEILWQIEKVKETSFNPRDRYIGVVTHDQDTITTGNWNGMVVDVELRNGKVKAKRFLK